MPFEPRRFRDVMGRFATGVTVITAGEGEALRGMTANSFTSVSLDPPLVLCCVATNAGMHPLFASGERFAINMLAADQEAQSRHFAKSWAAAHPMPSSTAATTPLLWVGCCLTICIAPTPRRCSTLQAATAPSPQPPPPETTHGFGLHRSR
jgi:hypothetical protein